jgi:lipoprotein-releasing system ATP-binding protein
MMPALVARMGKKEASVLATEILAKVGLAGRALHKPGELSGGEQQRVALARALALQPEVLLADEPTGNLDERTGEKIISLVLDLNREKGLTTIVVTHNQAIAERMNRRLTIVNGVVEELK